MTQRITRSTLALLLLAASAAACDGITAPGKQSTILLSGGSDLSPSLAMVALSSYESSFSSGSVSIDQVAAITLTVTHVQVLPANQDEENDASWIGLDVTAGAQIDLMALSESDVELAKGNLSEGSYQSVRLFFENASIVFNEPVAFGSGPEPHLYAANEAYPLHIPSGDQSGVKVPTAGFQVTAESGDVVTLVFDGDASVQAVQALPSAIQMSPVFTAK
jgi:hypothetical protein